RTSLRRGRRAGRGGAADLCSRRRHRVGTCDAGGRAGARVERAAGVSPTCRWTAIGAVLATLCLGVGIGSTELWPPDEPRVAAVSRDMLREGNWLVPLLNGRPF